MPDTVFDRQRAVTLAKRASDVLAGELASAGKGEQFDMLKPWLLGEFQSLSQADAARRLGSTEVAAKVAIHRLRKRFPALVKSVSHPLPPVKLDGSEASLLSE